MALESSSRGIFRLPLKEYGRSLQGSVLQYVPCEGPCRILVIAGIHGEEPETTFLLSRCLRAFDRPFKNVAFVLCANPDGMTLGTRGNLRGVDLNRNFPTSNWTAGEVMSRSVLEAPRDTVLSAGTAGGTEPEVRALLDLIAQLKPASIVSMHAPIACVDAPSRTPLVDLFCKAFNLPWLPDIGYPTPGSLGTWCKEQSCGNPSQKQKNAPIECVTLELPRMSLEALFDRYGRPFIELLENL